MLIGEETIESSEACTLLDSVLQSVASLMIGTHVTKWIELRLNIPLINALFRMKHKSIAVNVDLCCIRTGNFIQWKHAKVKYSRVNVSTFIWRRFIYVNFTVIGNSVS